MFFFRFYFFPFYVNFYFSLPKSKPLNGKDEDFSLFIKSGHVLYCFSWVVYSCLKAFGKENNGKIQLTV